MAATTAHSRSASSGEPLRPWTTGRAPGWGYLTTMPERCQTYSSRFNMNHLPSKEYGERPPWRDGHPPLSLAAPEHESREG